MIKIFTLLLLFCLSIFAVTSSYATENWQLILAEDPLSKQSICLMISATRQTEDGQTKTPVSLIYNGSVFIAKTKSNIDLSYPDIGLQVDNKKRHNIDRLHENSNAVFKTKTRQLLDEFINGLSAKLTLGFWPTWPKTRSYTTEFDLRGFTKTYKTFQHCQKTGDILQ